MAESNRIDDLKKRVQKDPTSIAFAQLGEEYRREGRYQDAIDTCRGGLAHHPLYLSARVTLGRALMELEQFDEARLELETVVQHAPDNLAAIRTLAALHKHHDDAAVADAELALESQPSPEPGDADNASTPLEAGLLPPVNPVLTELERWLDAIVGDRGPRL